MMRKCTIVNPHFRITKSGKVVIVKPYIRY